jgi:hypothetical protein
VVSLRSLEVEELVLKAIREEALEAEMDEETVEAELTIAAEQTISYESR